MAKLSASTRSSGGMLRPMKMKSALVPEITGTPWSLAMTGSTASNASRTGLPPLNISRVGKTSQRTTGGSRASIAVRNAAASAAALDGSTNSATSRGVSSAGRFLRGLAEPPSELRVGQREIHAQVRGDNAARRASSLAVSGSPCDATPRPIGGSGIAGRS